MNFGGAATEAVIFDLDGLLLDSERVSRECWFSVAGNFGYDLGNVYDRLIGSGMTRCDEILMDHFGEGFPIRELRKLKNELFDQRLSTSDVPLKPGAREILNYVRAQGRKTALGTGSMREIGLRKIAAHGLDELFDHLVFGDEVVSGKPAPDIFLAAANKLEVAPGNCLVLEDSNVGVQAALSAGMETIMVVDLTTPGSQVADRGVRVVKSLFSLLP